ncbi:MAG: hypothetical protein ACRYFU_14405 [Janthinobacterium lividum]
MNSTARSVFAVIDGLLLFLALEGVFYAIAFLGLHKSFDTPTPTYLICNLGWGLVAAVLGGYTAARVARRLPVQHGIAVAVPLLVLGAYNIHKGLGNRNTPYVLAFNIFVPLCCILGAFLYSQRKGARGQTRRAI